SLVEKRRPRRKSYANEKEKRKSDIEYSRNELKVLLAQFGTKTKVAEDLERDVIRLQEDIERLLAKVTKKRKVNKTIQITPPPQSPTILRRRSTDFLAKRSFHAHSYVEPYEPAVHGTFGVDQTTSFGLINSIQDFFADILIGNRRFGVSNYEGLVPV
ncbi:390_t:CDS:2, partial [Dentiscutata erythropus]